MPAPQLCSVCFSNFLHSILDNFVTISTSLQISTQLKRKKEYNSSDEEDPPSQQVQLDYNSMISSALFVVKLQFISCNNIMVSYGI